MGGRGRQPSPQRIVTARAKKIRTGAAAVAAVALLACDGSRSNPVAPSASGAAAGSGGLAAAAAADPGLPRGDVRLKATAPALLSPADGATVTDSAVRLAVGQARADFVDNALAVRLRIQVWSQPYRPGATPAHEHAAPQTPAGIRHTVPRGVLADQTGYLWRAQAMFEGANGPWSEVRAFRVELPKIGAPDLRTPTDGMQLATRRPTLTVVNPQVTGAVGAIFIEAQVARDRNFTDGVRSLRAPLRDADDTALPIGEDLASGAQYYWRARGVSDRVEGAWSTVRSFRTPAARFGAPVPVTPYDGQTTDTLRPIFRVDNPQVAGVGDALFIELQIVRNRQFTPVDHAVREQARPRGNTDLQPPSDLAGRTRYFWRARGVAGSRTGDWSVVRSFRTPGSGDGSPGSGGGSPGAGGSPNAPFTTRGGRPPDLRRVVEQVAREHPDDLANSCPEEGGTWNFLDRVVERLRAIDGRWGYNCKRGDCRHISVDVVDYYRGRGNSRGDAQNSTDVAIIDIIFQVCGPGANPRPAWIDQTQATADAGAIGRWKYPR